MNKQQLASKIWASANKMRSKIEANEYKDYILGFIFYKFLSDKEIGYLKQNGVTDVQLPTITEEYTDAVQMLQQDLGYFISYENLFCYWLQKGKDFTVADVRDAISAFNRLITPQYKKLFNNILDTLQTGLSKLGANAAEQSKAVRDLIGLIQEIPTDGRQDYDVLGFVYEYLISNFAANAGKKAGEFYTPHEVSVMMSDIIAHHLKDNEEIRIYDPTSGSGSLLINIGKSVSRHIANKDNIKYYAQELKQNTFNLTRMNLIMRGINPANIEVRNGDTLEEDWPYFDESDPQGTYDPLYVDAVVSNPPYSQDWNPKNDLRYENFGLAPKGCADFAFLLHDLYHVKPSGIMTIVLPHGVLYRGGSEWQIRKALVENNHIDAIIGLPEKVFFGTGISTIVMVLKRTTRKDENILFVDASRGYEKEGKNNKLRACDIKKIVDIVTNREELTDFSRLVSRDVIRQNEYNLNISRYVDSSDKPEKYDIYATMFGGIPVQDINELQEYWDAFPSLAEELFTTNEYGYRHLAIDSFRQIVNENIEVKQFEEKYNDTLADFPTYLYDALISPMLTLHIQQTEEAISNELFARLHRIPLIDVYAAYQWFSDEWKKVSADLEILQTEGWSSVRQIDPHMVIKNNEEVQDGWEGHLLPFEIVQNVYLYEELESINTMSGRMDEIEERLAQIIDNFTPEERSKSILNDDNTKFVVGETNKESKRIIAEVTTPLIELLRTFPTKKKEKEEFLAAYIEIPWTRVEPDKSGKYGKTQANALIKILQTDFTFPEDTYEARVTEASSLLAEQKNLKEALGIAKTQLVEHTIKTIKSLSDDEATDILRRKWILPLCEKLLTMPNEIKQTMCDRISAKAKKYAVTYKDIAGRIQSAENRLYSLIGELQGGTADILGLTEFRRTLNVEVQQ